MESYILLKEPIPASQAIFLLGRIVEDPLNPLNSYCPENPHLSYLLDVMETTALDVQRSVDSSRDAGFKTKMFRLSSSVRGSSTKWQARQMVTRSLRQHEKAFHAIYSLHKEELNRLITSWRGIGYMAVSTKALIDGEIATQETDGNSVSVSASLDLQMGVSGGVNLGSSSSIISRATTESYTKIVDEQVFAICYRTVKIRTQWLSRVSELKLESSKTTFRSTSGKSSKNGSSRNDETASGPVTPGHSSPTIVSQDKADSDPRYAIAPSASTHGKVNSTPGEDTGDDTPSTAYRAQPVLQTLAAAPVGAVKIVEPLDSNQALWNAVLDLKTMNEEVIELDDMTESSFTEDVERPGKPAHVVLVTEDKHDELANNIVVFETSPPSMTEKWVKVLKDFLPDWPYHLLWESIVFPALEALEVLEEIPAAGTDRIRWRCVSTDFIFTRASR